MEQRYGLPDGLLHNIVTKGERSNADQVSSAGAKTVFQIIPATRAAGLKKFGIDAYLSAENAAEVAARLLKESLDRNKGDVREAVAEYHGGTDRANWGPRTRAYVGRVTGAAPAPAGNSTFDRVKAKTQEQQGPSIANVYEAYKTGKMTSQEKAEFERDVHEGAVLLPRGAELLTKPTAAVLPVGVIAAYSNPSEMTDAERDQLDADLASGAVAMPKGAILRRPKPRTPGEMIGMGARNVLEGAGGLVDVAAGPVGAVMDAFIPGDAIAPDPARKLASGLSDALGLAKPETQQEKLNAALIEGGTQGALTAGMALPLAGAPGATGIIAKGLAASPMTDIAASAAATGGMEAADQGGLGPGGQLAAGLLGAVTVSGAVKSAERIAARFGPKAAKVVEAIPREVLLDEKGALTDEGREVAARNDLQADDLKAAYDEAERPEPAAQASPAAREAVPVEQARAAEEAPAPAAEAAPAPEAAIQPPEAPLPASAAARVAQAGSEGVDLTRGQATQDFAAQDAEQTLRAQATGEGEKARAFYAKQQEQLSGAVDRFKQAFGDTNATAAERGALVKQALVEMRDAGKAGVTALYNEARDMAGKMGEAGSNLIQLETSPLLSKMRELFIDEGVDEGTRKALKQQAAKYGLIGDNPRTIEGETTVTLRDSNGEPGGKVVFTGPQQRLTIANAEDLRQAVSALYTPTGRNQQEGLKSLIDDAVEAAVERAAKEGKGDVGRAFGAARDAHKAQVGTFKAGDIVQKLIAWKKGTRTPQVLPEHAIRTLFAGGKEAVTELKKIKAVLLSKPTETSKAAWQAIQSHAVADIFEKALSPRGDISGARLNTAIKKFGADKLKVLLSPEDFNQLQKLRRIIGDATIPLDGTTNPSGSGYKVINFLAQQGMRLASVAKIVPGIGPIVDTAAGLVKTGREAAQSKATLEGVTGFTEKAAANADTPKVKADPRAYVRKFVSVAGSDEIIAPLMAAAANEDRP